MIASQATLSTLLGMFDPADARTWPSDTVVLRGGLGGVQLPRQPPHGIRQATLVLLIERSIHDLLNAGSDLLLRQRARGHRTSSQTLAWRPVRVGLVFVVTYAAVFLLARYAIRILLAEMVEQKRRRQEERRAQAAAAETSGSSSAAGRGSP